MKKNKIIIASILSMIGTSAMAQSSVNENFEASAKIENFCSIQANDVNFGVVSLPLTAQSASSQMRVLCTNNTPYKVDLNYGQYIAGGTTGIEGSVLRYGGSNSMNTIYVIQNSSGENIGQLYCGYSTRKGAVNFNNVTAAKLYGYSVIGWQTDTKKVCTSDGTLSGTKPTGWVGAYNDLGSQPVGGGIPEFGSMSGAQRGDKLAYKVTLPEDSSKTWTKGLNAYNSTGTGAEQLITVNAQIVPDKSSSKYVAQDIYVDNVTAEVTY